MLIMKKDTNSIREIVEFETERTKYVLLNKRLEFSKNIPSKVNCLSR